MKAMTVRVNDVDGVAGFVLPGDHVDVVLTRQIEKGVAMNDVVLQNTRVLAVDQIADQRADKPSVVKAVTLEVEVTNAQKLALAASVGTLSLVLRKAGEVEPGLTRRVTLTDLSNDTSTPVAESRFTTVGVIRASKKEEYSVPVEGMNSGAVASAGRGAARQ
jgi:pilus assembly protein CpaB